MKNIKWMLVLDKVGTVIVDRRFWAGLFTSLILVFGPSELLGNTDSLSNQAVEITTAIVRFVGIILPFLSLMASWTKRPPSGLRFKDTASEANEFVEKLLEAAKK